MMCIGGLQQPGHTPVSSPDGRQRAHKTSHGTDALHTAPVPPRRRIQVNEHVAKALCSISTTTKTIQNVAGVWFILITRKWSMQVVQRALLQHFLLVQRVRVRVRHAALACSAVMFTGTVRMARTKANERRRPCHESQDTKNAHSCWAHIHACQCQ